MDTTAGLCSIYIPKGEHNPRYCNKYVGILLKPIITKIILKLSPTYLIARENLTFGVRGGIV